VSRTLSLNMYLENSGVVEVAITLLTTTSTIRYLVCVSGVGSSNLQNNSHVSAVNLRGKGFEVVGGAKTGIQLGRILDPVP